MSTHYRYALTQRKATISVGTYRHYIGREQHMNEDEWLSLEQIAEELQLPLRTLYARRSRGDGPVGFKIGKHVRIRRQDLNKWVAGQADPRPAA